MITVIIHDRLGVPGSVRNYERSRSGAFAAVSHAYKATQNHCAFEIVYLNDSREYRYDNPEIRKMWSFCIGLVPTDGFVEKYFPRY